MYADDIALLADDEDNRQDMLNVLNDWCKVWNVTVNLDKSQIMHFRSASKPHTFFDFKYNGKCMVKVKRYKYLGIVRDYKLDLSVTAQSVAKSANRALSLLIFTAKTVYTKV